MTENAPRTAVPVLLNKYIVSPFAHAVKVSGTVDTPDRVSLSVSYIVSTDGVPTV